VNRYVYQDVSGELHAPGEVNNHHVWFNRRRYTSPLDKKFRNLGGFVLPTLIPPHKELHAEVPPPPKPHPSLMRATIQFASGMAHENVYDQFLELATFLEDRAPDRIVENLQAQTPFIMEGQVKAVLGE